MKEFWEEQALKFGEDVAAVNFDPIEDQFGAALLEGLVPDNVSVADLGCGNGRNLLALAKARPNGTFVGYDFAENMVSVAESSRQHAGLVNVRFEQLDATTPMLPHNAKNAFEVVVGKRVLINIKGDTKLQALRNIHDMLRADGTYIMTECFIEPLNRINEIRILLRLERISVKSFNEYLTDEFLTEIKRHFTVDRFIDMGSLYYFISRIFNAYLTEGAPDYFAPINQLASKLVLSGVRPLQGYAPEVTYVLKKPSEAGLNSR
jgi:ubiquinone/menaquinone biosynthesis C-methylase UbiE